MGISCGTWTGEIVGETWQWGNDWETSKGKYLRNLAWGNIWETWQEGNIWGTWRGGISGKLGEREIFGEPCKGEYLGNLARGKHWNSLVSSPSSVTRPAIPPSMVLAVKGAKWGLVCNPRQTGAHQAFRLIALLRRNKSTF